MRRSIDFGSVLVLVMAAASGCKDNGLLLGQSGGTGNSGGATSTSGSAQGGASLVDGSVGQGGASLVDGAASGGTSTGGNATGGTAGSTSCNGQTCTSAQLCCGPSQCGSCISKLSGANCPTSCPGGTVDCLGAIPASFPIFDRNCSTDSECTMVTHRTDCCGSSILTGIATRAAADFQTAEQTCESQYPACTCAAHLPTTDTGKTVDSTVTAFVTCVGGTCTTDAR